MSFCFCSSLSLKSMFLNRNSNVIFPWTRNPNTKPLKFYLNLRANVQGGGAYAVEVLLYPDETISQRTNSPLELAEPDAAVTGVADAAPQEARNEVIRSKKSKDVEEKDEDSRFKLRNGREVSEEKAYLVGVARKGSTDNSFGIEESLSELAQLADTAGLAVVGSTYQNLAAPNPRTYIGSGKVAVIFDDELSPGQLRNLGKMFGSDVRVCDRTALILDIFNQRAATHEAALQVSLA